MLADVTIGDLIWPLIVTAVSVAVALGGLIAAYLRYLTKRLERRINETDTTELTKAVYESVNGNGLTGSIHRVEAGIKRIETSQKEHEVKDDRRFAQIEKYVGMPDEQR